MNRSKLLSLLSGNGSTLRVIQRLAEQHGLAQEIDLLPKDGDPKDLYGLIRSGARNPERLSA